MSCHCRVIFRRERIAIEDGRDLELSCRTILPKKIGNLLVAGCCIDGDKISHAATRKMSCCAVVEQGVGAVAAMSVKSNQDVSRVDISRVQSELMCQDCVFIR